MYLFDELKEKLNGKKIPIVFPEGEDIRVLSACVKLNQESYIHPIVLGNDEIITELADDNNLNIDNLEIINPKKYSQINEMAEALFARRKGKLEQEKALELCLNNPNYFGTMLVYLDKAKGLVSGAVGSTADTVRPGLQIIKMKPGYKLVSGAFLMLHDEDRKLFSDCAININPNAEELSEIAKCSSITAKEFGIEPRIAMLSFSSMGSAKSPEQEKVATATKIAKEKYPELILDGELQFDAALVESIGHKKAPNSKVAGCANTFIFPNLDAGNIGYKIAERLGKYEAIGPILQGMAKPVNDLSRGCNSDDVYKLALITAIQSLD
ncbi:MAG: phosphate acetyltransferase [Erysipelotrichaceae bacterium]|nr:phosphate acetyltransferase [Erysipelotrichaceae bacterium]